jgi:hypothetical protein
MLGPVLGTSLYAISPDAVWIGCGIAGVIAATLALAARRLPAPVLEGPTPAADAVGV